MAAPREAIKGSRLEASLVNWMIEVNPPKPQPSGETEQKTSPRSLVGVGDPGGEEDGRYRQADTCPCQLGGTLAPDQRHEYREHCTGYGRHRCHRRGSAPSESLRKEATNPSTPDHTRQHTESEISYHRIAANPQRDNSDDRKADDP